jgi:hypothetical protein
VLEAFVELALELSVVVARSPDGDVRAFPVAENHHARHVLDLTVMPARVDADVADRAQALARRVVTGLGVVGLACVELFLTRDGDLWVNEVAPRPHNSGHVTIEACRVDQFEQQVRAVCGLPLGDPAALRPGAMANLLGDLWGGGEPDWRGRARRRRRAAPPLRQGRGAARPQDGPPERGGRRRERGGRPRHPGARGAGPRRRPAGRRGRRDPGPHPTLARVV